MLRKQRILTATAIAAFALTSATIAYDYANDAPQITEPTPSAQVQRPTELGSTPQSNAQPIALAGTAEALR